MNKQLKQRGCFMKHQRKRQHTRIMTTLFMLLTAFSVSALTITDAEGLKSFRDDVNDGINSYEGQTVLLGNTIDISDEDWVPIGTGTRSGSNFAPTNGAFKGTFDGQNNTITGLTISSVSASYVYGLFGGIDGGTVKNLKLDNVNIDMNTETEPGAVGGAVGMLTGGGTVENVTVNGTITAQRGHGGIVGRMTKWGTIKNCVNNAEITGSGSNIGGIVSAAYYTTENTPTKGMAIIGCINNGTVTGTTSSASVTGGIAGFSSANINNCKNTADIIGNNDSAHISYGGIVGEQQNYGKIDSCINEGNISGATKSGGIVGLIRYSGLRDNYLTYGTITLDGNINRGSVTARGSTYTQLGGILGEVYSNIIFINNRNEYTFGDSISTIGTGSAAGLIGTLTKTNQIPDTAASIVMKNNYTSFPLAVDNSGGNAFVKPLQGTKSNLFVNIPEKFPADSLTIENNTYEYLGKKENLIKQFNILEAMTVPDLYYVNAVVSNLTNAADSVRMAFVSDTDQDYLADIEQHYINQNTAYVKETSVNKAVTSTLLKKVDNTTGLALSIPLTISEANPPFGARLVLADNSSKVLPATMDANSGLVVDINLEIIDDDSEPQIIEDGVQPVVPFTTVLHFNNTSGIFKENRFVAYHFDDTEDEWEKITPAKIEFNEDDKTVDVTLILSSLSVFAFGNLAEYTITWKSSDTTFKTEEVVHGKTPTTPSPSPTKTSTAQYDYTFKEWSPAISAAVGEKTYTAVFDSTIRKYTITWEVNGVIVETDLNVTYGIMPTFNGATPTKASTAEFSYTFTGWSPTVASVTGAQTYTAQFSSTVRKYTCYF